MKPLQLLVVATFLVVPLCAQDPARMKRIEDRLAKLEQRMDAMIGILERMTESAEAIQKREREARPSLPAERVLPTKNPDRGFDMVSIAQRLIDLKAERRRLQLKLEASRPLAGDLVSSSEVAADESALRSAHDQIELLQNALFREKRLRQTQVREAAAEFERVHAAFKVGAVTQMELNKVLAKQGKAQMQLDAVNDALRLSRRSGDPEARVKQATSDVKAIYAAAMQFKMMKRRLPTITDLTTKDAQGRAYLESLGEDPWGKAYVIAPGEGGRFQVISLGPDGRQGTEDDVAYPAAGEPEKKSEPVKKGR